MTEWSRWADAEPIEIYCDDDRHARGKVAEVAMLLVLPPAPGQWQVNLSPYGSAPRRRPAHGRLHGKPTAGNHYEIPCPLCPRSPQLSGPTLESVADLIAREDMRRVSLTFLERCAGTLHMTDGI